MVRQQLERDRSTSLRSIARMLEESGYRNRAGQQYHASAVQRMVRRIVADHPHLKRSSTLHVVRTDRVQRIAAVVSGVAA
jgi:hypothetical protein